MKLKIINKIFSLFFIFLFAFVVETIDGQTLLPDRQTRNLQRIATQLEMSGRFSMAAERYIAILKQNPRNLSSYFGAKRCLLRTGNYDKFENLILFLQKSRRDLRYEVDLAEIEFLKGHEKKALAHWKRIITENSKNHQAYSLVGSALMEHHLDDEAINIYKQARKTFKDPNIYIFEMANIYASRSDFKPFTLEYLKYLQKNPGQVSFIESRFASVTKTPEISDEIAKTLKKEIKSNEAISKEIYQILGGLFTRQKKYKEAFSFYLKLENENEKGMIKRKKAQVKGQALFNFGNTALKDGAFEYAQNAFQLLVKNYPKSSYALRAEFGLAMLYEGQKMYPQAIQAYNNFANLHPKSIEALRAKMRIGDIYFNNLFQVDRAKEAYQKIVRDYPNTSLKTEALFRLAACGLVEDDLKGAKANLQKILHESRTLKNENRQKAELILAKISFYQARPTAALQQLQKIVNADNKSKTPDLNENDALELSMLIQENLNDSTGLAVLAKARLLNMQRRYKESKKFIDDYLQENNQTQLQDELYLLLADDLRHLGEYNLAIEKMNQVYGNEEGLYRDLALLKAGEIYQDDLKDLKKAQESYESLLADFPTSIYLEEARKKIRNLDNIK